jgi:hypothetical protein
MKLMKAKVFSFGSFAVLVFVVMAGTIGMMVPKNREVQTPEQSAALQEMVLGFDSLLDGGIFVPLQLDKWLNGSSVFYPITNNSEIHGVRAKLNAIDYINSQFQELEIDETFSHGTLLVIRNVDYKEAICRKHPHESSYLLSETRFILDGNMVIWLGKSTPLNPIRVFSMNLEGFNLEAAIESPEFTSILEFNLS